MQFRDAGHLAWTDLVSRYQESVDYYWVAFLDAYVRGDWGADPARRRDDIADLRVK